MIRYTSLIAATFMGLSTPLIAQQRPVVVELYTSQGCSSCPPADAILSELSGHEDVIAIALHVDYWDYIGWKDEFGNPAHAQRQRAYATAGDRQSVYTPEMVINGVTDIVGSKPMKVSGAIAKHSKTPPRMALEAERIGETLQINGSVPTGQAGPMDVHVLRLINEKSTEITRGENRGKTIAYTHIAHDWRTVGTWDGKSPLEMVVSDIAGDNPVVVLVQESGAGPIVSAAQLD